MGNTTLRNVKVEKTTGNVTLKNVTTDSDTTIVENDGNVKIMQSMLGSDIEIKGNRRVTIKSSSAALEDVVISNNEGKIIVDSNCDLSLSIVENGVVKLTNNNETDAMNAGATCNSDGFGLTDVEVSKNTGGVAIKNNTGELLTCSDNSPAPTGSGNTFTFADGQCAGL